MDIDSVVTDFELSNDLGLEVSFNNYSSMSFQEFEQQLKTQFMTGVEPDVIICGPELDFSELADKKLLMDLSSTKVIESIDKAFYEPKSPYYVMNISNVRPYVLNKVVEEKISRYLDQVNDTKSFIAILKKLKIDYPDYYLFAGGFSDYVGNSKQPTEYSSTSWHLVNELLISDFEYLSEDVSALESRLEDLKWIFSVENYKVVDGFDVEFQGSHSDYVKALDNVLFYNTVLSEAWGGTMYDREKFESVTTFFRPPSSTGISYKYGDYIAVSDRTLHSEVALNFIEHYLRVAPMDEYTVEQYTVPAGHIERYKRLVNHAKDKQNWSGSNGEFKSKMIDSYMTFTQGATKCYFETAINRIIHEQIDLMIKEDLEASLVAKQIVNKVKLYQKENQ
jgi:ABC-type glycerol-3-phosphate transport system substrate-binding protein